jgi:predicted dehydrogenase
LSFLSVLIIKEYMDILNLVVVSREIINLALAGMGAGKEVMNKKYRVAVIGRTGRGNYGHDLDTVWLELDNVEIVAVADENTEGRTQAAERLRTPRAYADYREMLHREKPDLVSVAPRTPDCHRDMALACAEAGVRGVLMEKPLATSLQEADEIVAACERSGMKMAICHQARYGPRLQVARDLVVEGRLGDLLEMRARGKEDHRGGGEDLMVLGTHLMDLMRLFAGEPQWCFARVTEGGHPITRKSIRTCEDGIGPFAGDMVSAVYGFTPPLTGYFASHRARHGVGARFALHLLGSKGQMTIKTDLTQVFLLEDPSWNPGQSGAKWKPVTSGGVDMPETQPPYTLRYGNSLIARDLIRSVEEDRQPFGSVYDGRAALEMILAVYESQRLNAPVSLPLAERIHPLERFD